jgi:hypothetical protein
VGAGGLTVGSLRRGLLEKLQLNVQAVLTGIFERGEEVPVLVCVGHSPGGGALADCAGVVTCV